MFRTVVRIGRFDPNSFDTICVSEVFHTKPFSELRPMIEEGKDKLEWTRQVSSSFDLMTLMTLLTNEGV